MQSSAPDTPNDCYRCKTVIAATGAAHRVEEPCPHVIGLNFHVSLNPQLSASVCCPFEFKVTEFIILLSNTKRLKNTTPTPISILALQLVERQEPFADAPSGGTEVPLPKGFDSWITYAVSSFNYREVEQLWLFDNNYVSRNAIRSALWKELNEIRAKAGLPYIEPY